MLRMECYLSRTFRFSCTVPTYVYHILALTQCATVLVPSVLYVSDQYSGDWRYLGNPFILMNEVCISTGCVRTCGYAMSNYPYNTGNA